MEPMKAREHFGSRMAVILAMAGSAIGLGNIWRFPYLVGQNGGAAFILVYLVACVVLALPVFMAEAIIGRRSGCNSFGAMRVLAPGTRWKWLAMVTVITPMLILSYYSVVGGWSVDYFIKACAFRFTGDTSGIFGRFISSTWEPIITHTVFMALTAGIVLLGVKKGIEKFTKITMPMLFVLIVAIVIYGLTILGSWKGVEYMVKPDFSKLDANVVATAMGQAFFSLSLGVGTILTYASYMQKQENIVTSGVCTASFDLLFALLAGFAVMPAVFAAGIAPEEGAGLVFQTLPFIFSHMGWAGAIVSILFFFSILIAALTSSISVLEVGVAYLVEEKGWTRVRSTLVLALATWALGVLCSLSFGPLSGVKLLGLGFFDIFDKLCSNWLMPFGGLLFSLFVGWKMSKADVRDEFTNGGTRNVGLFNAVYFLLRYVAPVGILVVFVTNLLF